MHIHRYPLFIIPSLLIVSVLIRWTYSQNRNSVISFSHPSGNLIKNGSFENNYTDFEFESWYEGFSHNPEAYQPVLADDGVPTYHGRRMAAIEYLQPVGEEFFLMSDLFQVKPNQEYTLFFRYRVKDLNYSTIDDNKVRPSVHVYTAREFIHNWSTRTIEKLLPDGETYETDLVDISKKFGEAYENVSVWTLYAHHFTTGTDANYGNIHLLHANDPGVGGNFYFDDVSVVEGHVNASDTENPAHPDNVGVTNKFMNGKNNVIQTVTQDKEKDMVVHTFFDDLGRVSKTTLPIGDNFGGNQHRFIPSITGEHDAGDFLGNFYNQTPADENPDDPKIYDVKLDDSFFGEAAPEYPEASGVAYSEVRYENSPLGRDVESSGSGDPWKMGSTHTLQTKYGATIDLNNDHAWRIGSTCGTVIEVDGLENNRFSSKQECDEVLSSANSPCNIPGISGECEFSGSKSNGGLGNYFIKEFKDIDGQTTREYTDRMENLVMKASQKDDDNWIITRYEYDENDNLSKIVAPENPQLVNNETHMKYNTLNQLISEITPSTNETQFIYDKLGRPRFTQTANQAIDDKFSYVKYDRLGRVIETGEVLVTSGPLEDQFEQEKADSLIYPIKDETPNITVSVRTMNHYDNDDFDPELTCDPNIGTGIPGMGRYLIPETPGVIQASSYKNINAAHNTLFGILQNLNGITSTIPIYAVFPEGTVGQTKIGPGTQLPLKFVDNEAAMEVRLEFRAITDTDPIAIQIQSDILEQTQTFTLGKYLHGKLVKSISCNHEVFNELEPGQITKIFDYDIYGNVTHVYQQNTFVQTPGKEWQLIVNEYDVQNRLTKKQVCNGIDCSDNELSHEENYSYDQLGRVSRVTDKNGATIIHNHYNRIGQLSAQGLGGDITSTSDERLLIQYNYHLHGWLKKMKIRKMKDMGGAGPIPLVFQEELFYENSSSPRFDGNITRAIYDYFFESESPQVYEIGFDYQYDNLNRLVDAASDPPDASKDAGYTYFDDGRISVIDRGGRTGAYQYDPDFGTLKSVEGDLDENRDMNSVSHDVVFQYDNNGNLTYDFSKGYQADPEEDPFPMMVWYRSDNLPYKFEIKNKETGDLFTYYMLYDEEGNRVNKVTYKNDIYVSTKSYYGSGKEIREQTSYTEFHKLAGVGRVNYTSNPLGEKEFYLKDHLGSTREVYKLSDGQVTWAYEFFPYGKQNELKIGSEEVTEKFTGKELDEGIELSYFGARFYDADLGVWVSPDIARQFLFLYSYTGNKFNPINGFDNDGKRFNEAGLALYKEIAESNFFQSPTLEADLKEALASAKLYNVEYVDEGLVSGMADEIQAHMATIKLKSNLKGFEKARIFRHELQHGKKPGQSVPDGSQSWHSNTLQIKHWIRELGGMMNFLKWNANQENPDQVYLRDLKVSEEALNNNAITQEEAN